MGLERRNLFNPDSAHYKPLGQDGRSLPFTSNPPPLSQKEHPTQKDKDLANRQIPSLETRIADFMGEQKGAVSVPAAVGIGIGSGLIGGVGGFFLAKEVFAAENEISINSFPNSFNDKVNKITDERERFDNSAKEGIITERNTIQLTLEEYAKIAPSPINKEAPEKLNILLPIQFAEGSVNRALQIKRGRDYMGGGIRKLSSGADGDPEKSTGDEKIQVTNSLTIEDGLKEGDILRAPASGIISSGLTIRGKDKEGNEFTTMMGGRFDLEPIKNIPPSKLEEFALGQFKIIESFVEIKEGEPIGRIKNPKKGPLGMAGAGGIGQFQMLTFSTVTREDGTKQVGAADSRINISPDGKIYTLK